MAERIGIISAERVRDELVKLVCAPHPRRGLTLMVDTGLAEQVLPELPALALERDEHHRHKDVYEHSLIVLEQAIAQEDRLGGGPDPVVRFAALLHDIGKPRTRRFLDDGTVTFHHHDVVGAKLARKRLQALRFSAHDVEAIAHLVELHLRFHGYGDGDWTDAAVRRYVRDAGDGLERLHILTRADCTTRNRRKADRLRAHLRRPGGADRPAVGGGGAGRHAARPRRQRDHVDPRHPARARRRRGVLLPPGAAARRGPARRGGGHPAAARLVGGPVLTATAPAPTPDVLSRSRGCPVDAERG